MKIVISGGSGFIGSVLTRYLKRKGDEVIPLSRDYFQGDAPNDKLKNALQDADVVINLAGTPINHRWSKSYKEKMFESRIITTRKIVEIINSQARKPKVFISASAVGYYPIKGCHNEYSTIKGDGFLATLCEAWEQEAKKISPQVRLAVTRFGVVMSKKGGAFPLLSLPARLKVAAVIGPGNQWLPWIYLGDLVKAIEHIINEPSLSGTVNFVAPQQITNREVMKAVAKHEKSWLVITIPKFFFRLALGKASTFITTGQCVVPKKLIDSGFAFSAPTIEDLLEKIYLK